MRILCITTVNICFSINIHNIFSRTVIHQSFKCIDIYILSIINNVIHTAFTGDNCYLWFFICIYILVLSTSREVWWFQRNAGYVTNRQTHRALDIATYRLNWPMCWFSENLSNTPLQARLLHPADFLLLPGTVKWALHLPRLPGLRLEWQTGHNYVATFFSFFQYSPFFFFKYVNLFVLHQ